MNRDATVVLALVVVNDAAGQSNLAALAVDHVVGRGYMLFQRRRIRDQLEDRAGLVDVADGMIAQQFRRGVAKVVGVEGGADGEGQNLAGVHVLDNHCAVGRLGALHGVIQRPLGHELNVLVDGQHQVPARLGFALAGAEHVAARIQGRIHAAGDAVQLRLELQLQAAQAVVVHAHIAQHLRGDLIVRIEALKLFLEVDAFEAWTISAFTRAAISGVTRRATQAKLCPLSEPRGNLLLGGLRVVGVGVDDGGQRVGSRLLVVKLSQWVRRRWSPPARSWPARAGCGHRGRRGAEPPRRCVCCCFSARSTNSWWRTTWSQKRRKAIRIAQARKNRQISQKRGRLRGMARGAGLRFRLGRTVGGMGNRSSKETALYYCAEGTGGTACASTGAEASGAAVG